MGRCKGKHKTIDLKTPKHMKISNDPGFIAIDVAIAETIKWLWDNGVVTTTCCCGENIEGEDNRPNLILPDYYSDTDIDIIADLIRKADVRDWLICQYRLIEVGKKDKPKRPFMKVENQLTEGGHLHG